MAGWLKRGLVPINEKLPFFRGTKQFYVRDRCVGVAGDELENCFEMCPHPANCIFRKKIGSKNKFNTFGLADNVQLERELMIIEMAGSSAAVQTKERLVRFAIAGRNGFRKTREPCFRGGESINCNRNGPTSVGLVIANGEGRGVFTCIAMNEIRPRTDNDLIETWLAEDS